MDRNLKNLRKAFLEEQTDGYQNGEINPWVGARRRPESLSEAIKAECYNCVGGSHDAGGTDRIKHCPITRCEIWLLRPYQPSGKQLAIGAAKASAAQPAAHAVLDPVSRSQANPQSRRLAIRAYCWVCYGAGHNANTGRLIGRCENYKCGLWDVRPYQGKTEEAAADEKPAEETDSESILDRVT